MKTRTRARFSFQLSNFIMTQLLLLYLDVQRSRLDPLGDLSLQFYMSDCAPSLWTSGDDVSRFTTDNLPSQITSFDFQFSLLHSEVLCSLLAPTIGGAKARSSAYPLDYFKGLADLDNLRDALVDASQTFAAFMDNPLSVPGALRVYWHHPSGCLYIFRRSIITATAMKYGAWAHDCL